MPPSAYYRTVLALLEAHGGSSLFCLPPSGVGAPLAAGLLEETIALGCNKFIACGGAGVLDGTVVVGHPVIPTASSLASPVPIGILQNSTMMLHNHSTTLRSGVSIIVARQGPHPKTLIDAWRRRFVTNPAMYHIALIRSTGLAVRGEEVRNAGAAVESWLRRINLLKR